MQDFIYYKLQLFSGVIFFVQAFLLLTSQIKGKESSSPYTFFSVFLILHSVTLFTEMFLLFHSKSLPVDNNIFLYLTSLNGLSLLSLSAAIWQVVSANYSFSNRLYLQIIFSLFSLLFVFVSGLNPISFQYKLVFILWMAYSVVLWIACYRTSQVSSQQQEISLYGRGIAFAVCLASFSELLPKAQIVHSVYSLLTGCMMIVIFIYHFQRRDKLVRQTDFQRLNSQIQALHLRNLGEWSAALAHEVKTPLHSAMLSNDIALRQTDKEQPVYAHLVRAKESIARAVQVSEGVLNYARSTQTSNNKVNIEHSLGSVVNLLAFRLREFRVDTRIDKQICVWGDDYLLQSVWTNLLTNAIEACDTENKHLVIHVYGDESNVHIQIINSGSLDESLLKQIEKPFFTTKKEQGGVGLGLNIVNTILQSHQGELRFYQHLNGTCAHVMLPRFY